MWNKLSGKQRNKLLKRVLPLLAVLVVYFTFLGPKFTANADQALAEIARMKAAYQSDQQRANDLARQKAELLAELDSLRKTESKPQTDNNTKQTSFFGDADYASRAISRLNECLAKNNLRVIEDGRQAWNAAKATLPATVNDLGKPVQASNVPDNDTSGAALWRVRFSGKYPDVYRALEELAHDDISIIPVSLEMTAPEDDSDMLWILQIWI